MYPLNNENLAKRDPDRKAFFGAEDKLLRRYLGEAGSAAMPADARRVSAICDGNAGAMEGEGRGSGKTGDGVPAVVRRGQSEPGRRGANLRNSIREVGRARGCRVQGDCRISYSATWRASAAGWECLCTCIPAPGAGRYYDIPGVNPTLLVPVIMDPAMKQDQLRVGARRLAIHPGDHGDAGDSERLRWTFRRRPPSCIRGPLGEVIRGWLEFGPEKVLFATDASPWNEQINWEESGWLSNMTARDALGLALTGMMRDREIIAGPGDRTGADGVAGQCPATLRVPVGGG